MKLVSVNISAPHPIQNAGKSGMTGIFKQPTTAPIALTPLGLTGDAVCDVDNHGGLDQSVYVFTTQDYAWWSHELGRDLAFGTFGENLTIDGFESATCLVGHVLRIGEIVLQITAPRIPCGTLAARMGDPGFVKQFRFAEHPGVYCRVLQAGTLTIGTDVTYERFTGDTVSVIEMFRDFYEPDLAETTILRHLAAPIGIRARLDMQRALKKLYAGRG